MKPYVMIQAPRPTRMAGVLAWLVGFAVAAGAGMGTAFVLGSVVLGALAAWARRRSARPAPPDAPAVADPSLDPDLEALRALWAVVNPLPNRSGESPEHVEARRE